jgi:phage repressor protein C with HTH and peptisase S24 domain
MREKFKRFDKYMKLKGLNDNQVSRQCNLSQGLIGQARSGKSDLGAKTIDKILNVYQDLNKIWLLTGEGEMLNNQCQQEEEGTFIPLLPVSAQGGSLNEFVVSIKGNECEKVLSPVRGADFAIPVAGDSMAPEYPNGSQVHIKKINEHAFIEWGKVYVLDTCNGVVIKRVVPSEREGYIRCLSINTNPIFAPFDVAMSDIYGIYRVMLCLSIK